MPPSLFVLGTYDQPESTLFDVDLMQYLAGTGVPPVAVVFKRSRTEQNPIEPRVVDVAGRGTVIHVADFNDAKTVAAIAAHRPDLLVYAGGRDLLRRPLLDAARLGCLGGHYGHLPEIRGMATVEWSVMLGIPPTVAIQRVTPGIDTGDVLMQARVPILSGDTYAAIRDRSYFMTKTMLALSTRGILHEGWQGMRQRVENGRQYYRLGPVLQERADRALAVLLHDYA